MWIKCNVNPGHKEVRDSMVQSMAIVLGKRWTEVYDDLCRIGREEYNMPGSDAVESRYLYEKGFEPFIFSDLRGNDVTVSSFCAAYPKGKYLLSVGGHMIVVIDGDYYDSWDSGNETPSVFWKEKTEGA